MVYPSFTADETLTSFKLNNRYPVTVYKQQTQDVVNLSTRVYDADLKMPLEPNASYKFKAILFVTGATAGDISVFWETPILTTGYRIGVGLSAGSAGSINETIRSTRYSSFASTAQYPTLSVRTPAREYGVIHTGPKQGTFQLAWTQWASNAIATRLHQFSSLTIQRIA